MPINSQDFEKRRPVSLRHIQGLIQRVHLRYPSLPKDKVALIVKSFFTILRRSLIAGELVQLHGIFNKVKLIYFKRNGYESVKAKLTTPEYFRQLK